MITTSFRRHSAALSPGQCTRPGYQLMTVVMAGWLLLSTPAWPSQQVAASPELARPPEASQEAEQLAAEIAKAMDIELAGSYFQEAEEACSSAAGGLWRFSLCVPMLLVEPEARVIVASQKDPDGQLIEHDGVWLGRWPEAMNIANTAVDWSGARWTMLMWPLPEDLHMRVKLMMHESFHNVQQTFGFPAVSPDNHHLDTRQGRLWLQLEWNALRKALSSSSLGRDTAIRDALIFRGYRRTLFPEAADEERALEMHEGLAELTGLHLSGLSFQDQKKHLRETLDLAKSRPSYVRSFAYWSGPAYGLLLEEIKPGWRKRLTPAHDLGWMIQYRLRMELPEDLETAAREAMGRYDGEAILAAELEREGRWQERIAGYKASLVEGPVLIIPLVDMSIQFNPSNLIPLGEHGAVYPTLRISDVWGVLEADGGALLASDWGNVRIVAPGSESLRAFEASKVAPSRLSGKGWTMALEPGWRIVPGARANDLLVEAEPADSQEPG